MLVVVFSLVTLGILPPDGLDTIFSHSQPLHLHLLGWLKNFVYRKNNHVVDEEKE